MTLKKIIEILDIKVLTADPNLDAELNHAFASDLMSDVLTLDEGSTLLISGLSNMQVIRTAEMSDIGHVIIGRNKVVSEEMVALAERSNIVLMKSPYSLFRISGVLYGAGLKPVF